MKKPARDPIREERIHDEATGGETVFPGPRRLLAVDDSITYLQELGSQLRQEGYDVVLARSGEEALELLAVQPVDGILLDLIMPGLSGQNTCKGIKQRADWRDIPLVMLTARDDRLRARLRRAFFGHRDVRRSRRRRRSRGEGTAESRRPRPLSRQGRWPESRLRGRLELRPGHHQQSLQAADTAAKGGRCAAAFPMSFFRHPEIYRSDVFDWSGGADLGDAGSLPAVRVATVSS
jgi:CheY-like chemotaxis protein